MALNFRSVKLTNWQIALIIGTPLAIGLGTYVARRIYATPGGEEKKRSKGKIEKQATSIDGTAPDKEQELKQKSAELGEKLSPVKEANSYKNEGNNCYRNGKYDEAIIFYDKAIDKCPPENGTDMAIFYQNRAASYEKLQKWSKVKEDCTNSLSYNQRYAKAYFRRARAHEATKDMLECLNDVTATCILEMFQNNQSIMYADRVLKETGRIDAEKHMSTRVAVVPSTYFIKTYLQSFVADPLQNINLPQSIEADAPARGFLCAHRAFREEKFDNIIPACTEEIESSESESQYKVEALLLRGTIHLLCGSYKESQQDFDAIIDNADADDTIRAYAYMRRASLYMQVNKREEALADFEAAEKLKPDNPDVYHQRAQVLLLLDNIKPALEQFEKAVRLAPNHSIAYVQKCYTEYRLALMTNNQIGLGSVVRQLEKAIDQFPNCVECYSMLAQVMADQQNFLQAQQYYDKAVLLAPKNASLLVHQAVMTLQWRGDIETAVSILNKAIELDDKCEQAFETLGTVEVQRANLKQAVELFEQAIRYSKSFEEVVHAYSLRNAAIAQINVTKNLGIDMNAISAMSQAYGTAM